VKPVYIWLLFIAGAFFSCKKQDGNIVLDGQGDGSEYAIARTDTLTLITGTVPEDSLPANGLPYTLIGNMTDPLLGKTTANAFASLLLLEPASDFPNTEEPDSAVLFIPMIEGLNFYGDRQSSQIWKVFPMNTVIKSSTVYYQGFEPEYDETQPSVFKGRVYNSTPDSVRYKKGKIQQRAGVQIKLSMDMAKKLMSLPKTAYQSDEGLSAQLPGLAIIPQDNDLPAGSGGIGVFSFSSTGNLGDKAHIRLYYRDTETFVFTFGGASRTVTKGKLGSYPAQVQEQLLQRGSDFTTTYVQSLSGLKTWIQIPYLRNITGGENVAINKAEIVFYLDKSKNTGSFFAPPRLNLFRPIRPNSLRNFVISDAQYPSYGGVYNELDGSYTFRITRHVQDVFNAWYLKGNDINYGLFLAVPTAEPVLSGRAAIDQTRTEIRITYTKLN